MRFHNITKDDITNGDGLRVVLWVSGCNHGCKGCHNPETWDKNSGIEFDKEAKKELMEHLKKDYVSGITISGGDPLYSENVEEVTLLCKEIKENFPDKTIWIYTGYCFDEIREYNILNFIDVLVDGKFIKELVENKLYWRGSKNQRVINIPQTLEEEKIILHCE